MSKRLKKIAEFLKESSLNMEDSFKLKEKYKEFGVKFLETITASFVLNIDPKKTDQIVKGYALLPHSVYKNPKVLVFTKEVKQDSDNVVYINEEFSKIDIIKKKIHANGKIYKLSHFTHCIASQEMLPSMTKIAKLLGTKGLMPNLRYNTVSNDVHSTLQGIINGQYVKFSSSEKVVHIPFANLDSSYENFVQNFSFILDTINSLKPSAIKNEYIQGIYLSSTMGFKVKINHKELLY